MMSVELFAQNLGALKRVATSFEWQHTELTRMIVPRRNMMRRLLKSCVPSRGWERGYERQYTCASDVLEGECHVSMYVVVV